MRKLLKSQLLLFASSLVLLVGYLILGGHFFSKSFYFFLIIYTLLPGLIAHYFAKKEVLKIPLFLKDKAGLWALVYPLGIVLLTMIFDQPFCPMRPAQSFGELMPRFFMKYAIWAQYSFFFLGWIFISLLMVFSIALLSYICVEYMFMGYLYEKLKTLGFWKCSLVIGVLEGIWVGPLAVFCMCYPDFSLKSILWPIIFFVLITPIKIYFRLTTKCIFYSAIFFGFLNYLLNIFVYLYDNHNAYLFGATGLSGFAALGCVNVILFLKIRNSFLVEVSS